jgi:hypothetical protein
MSLEARSLHILRLDASLEEKAAALALLWNQSHEHTLLYFSGFFSAVSL